MVQQIYQAINAQTEQVIVSKVKIAQDFRSRSIGLLDRTSLSQDEGLLIKPCNSIHTFFMKFPIDAIFLDKNGQVIKIAQNLNAWKLSGALLRGYMVLELAAGVAKKAGIKTQDLLKFR